GAGVTGDGGESEENDGDRGDSCESHGGSSVLRHSDGPSIEMAGMRLWRLAAVNVPGVEAAGEWCHGNAARDLPGQARLGARGEPRLLWPAGAGGRQAYARRALRHPATLRPGVAGARGPDLSHRGRR